MSDFRDELGRRQQEARQRSERGRRDAEEAAMSATGEMARWSPALLRRCQDAEAGGLGIRRSTPQAARGGRYIQELHRGDLSKRKTLRLVLDEPTSRLTWSFLEDANMRTSGRIDFSEADPDGSIGRLIGDFVEWSADVAPGGRGGQGAPGPGAP
jgi:hypothetical protein